MGLYLICHNQTDAEELVSKPPHKEFSLDANPLLAYYMLTQCV